MAFEKHQLRGINLEHFDLNRLFNQTNEIEDVNRYLVSYPTVRKNYRDSNQKFHIFTQEGYMPLVNEDATANSF